MNLRRVSRLQRRAARCGAPPPRGDRRGERGLSYVHFVDITALLLLLRRPRAGEVCVSISMYLKGPDHHNCIIFFIFFARHLAFFWPTADPKIQKKMLFCDEQIIACFICAFFLSGALPPPRQLIPPSEDAIALYANIMTQNVRYRATEYSPKIYNNVTAPAPAPAPARARRESSSTLAFPISFLCSHHEVSVLPEPNRISVRVPSSEVGSGTAVGVFHRRLGHVRHGHAQSRLLRVHYAATVSRVASDQVFTRHALRPPTLFLPQEQGPPLHTPKLSLNSSVSPRTTNQLTV